MIKQNLKIYLLLIALGFSLSTTIAQDKIITKEGSVIHADVVEVGFEIVKFKKSTYGDGPVFSIYIDQIYAIAYGDNTTDYFVDNELSSQNRINRKRLGEPFGQKERQDKILLSGSNLFENMGASIGVGLIDTYSQAEDGINNLDKKFVFPVINTRIWTEVKENINIGLQLSLVKFQYEGDRFNDYDETLTLSDVQENVLSLTGFVKYDFGGELFHPYGLFGLGFTRSNLQTQRDLAFIQEGPIFRINSSAQTINLAMLIRGGASVLVSKDFYAYFDLGTGISLLQIGMQFNFSKEESL